MESDDLEPTIVSNTNRCKQRREDRSPPGSTSPSEYGHWKRSDFDHLGQGLAKDYSCSGAGEWPPPGLTRADELDIDEGENIIGRGATSFTGWCEGLPYDRYRFYAIIGNGLSGGVIQPMSPDQVTTFMSATLNGVPDPERSPTTLEHPSLLSGFGDVPGSISLNYWVGGFSDRQPAVEFEVNIKMREVGLLWLLKRIRCLEFGLETDVDYLYSSLHEHLLQDPRQSTRPRDTIAQQVTDLVAVLACNHWIDFSSTANQTLAVYFGSENFYTRYQFFHQLVLSIELYLRLHSEQYETSARERAIELLPRKVAWDLVVAQRWLENIAIGRIEPEDGLVRFDLILRSKGRQVETLRDFAWALKWPNMGEVEYVLEETDRNEVTVENRSVNALCWFSGVILPGYTAPWLMMNALIDCDRATGDNLDRLTYKYRNSGFQYRTNTYWSWECIVGKVLGAARGVKQVAGWIGPCIYTPELGRIQCVQIRQKTPSQPRIRYEDVLTMTWRSDPLGPLDDYYPVDDYQLVSPDMDDIVDTVRMEKLSFKPWDVLADSNAPTVYDCAVTFAYAGLSWNIRLRYDVSFISADPCHSGPHVLFYDYIYTAIKVDKLLELEGWGTSRIKADYDLGCQGQPPHREKNTKDHEQDKVLVVEAFGVPDNEVCTRAWCAHFGLSAVTANIHNTCMACAIREAYAARVTVVILNEGTQDAEVEQVERRSQPRGR